MSYEDEDEFEGFKMNDQGGYGEDDDEFMNDELPLIDDYEEEDPDSRYT